MAHSIPDNPRGQGPRQQDRRVSVTVPFFQIQLTFCSSSMPRPQAQEQLSGYPLQNPSCRMDRSTDSLITHWVTTGSTCGCCLFMVQISALSCIHGEPVRGSVRRGHQRRHRDCLSAGLVIDEVNRSTTRSISCPVSSDSTWPWHRSAVQSRTARRTEAHQPAAGPCQAKKH